MNPTQPRAVFWLTLLVGFWAFYGLTGRDAWQSEEALALGSVLDQLQGGHSLWLAPAPLFTLVASLCARLAPFGLDLQDSARLASGLFTLFTLVIFGQAARRLLGPGYGAAGVLALMGSFGLLLRAHAFIPETALLAAWALFFLGLGWARSRPRTGGILLGLSLAALTLGLRGLPDLMAALVVMLLPLAFRAWQERSYRQAVLLGLGLGGLLILAGLALMGLGGHLDAWLQGHGLHRLLPTLGIPRMFSELAWFAWPLWPLALAALWHEHRRLARSPDLHLPLLALLALLLLAPAPAWSRLGGLLPLLLPLALLTAIALSHLRRGAAQSFYWFGVLCFLFFALAFWLYFSAVEWGLPTRLASHMLRLTPTYRTGSVGAGSIWLAAGITLVWLLAIPLFPRAQTRPVLVWSTGMVLTWILLAALFRPWAEAGWAYRPLLLAVDARLPPAACLAVDADPAMQAMARYHLPHHRVLAEAGDCPWRLSGTSRNKQDAAVPAGVEVLWQGARPRYRNQVYRLEYHRPRGQD